MCPFTLSGRIPVIALVGLFPANQLMGRRPFPRRSRGSFHAWTLPPGILSGITLCFHRLSPSEGCVTHVLLTSPPLSYVASYILPLDLHA